MDVLLAYAEDVPEGDGPAAGCAPCALAQARAALEALAMGGAREGRGPRPGAGRADNVSALSWPALAALTTTTSECAEGVSRATGAPCASKQVVAAMEAFAAAQGEAGRQPAPPAPPPPDGVALLPTARTPEASAVRAAAAALGCASESCVVANPQLRRFAAENGLAPRGAFERDLDVRFKAEGPRYTKAWASNYNIDDTLHRWARVFPEFYPCPFAMMDFDRTLEPFATVDLGDVLAGREAADLGPTLGAVRRPTACFGCVVNTDHSTGKGKHWVAVFVDCRAGRGPWTVEYFNSAGRPPPKAMVGWMERTRARLAAYRAEAAGSGPPGEVDAVAVTSVGHQESQSECGLYAMFYIRRRLEGAPYTDFAGVRIPDAAMTAFRSHVFRAA